MASPQSGNVGDAALRRAAARDLRWNLLGELIFASDAGYDEARKIWNAMIDKRPAMIVRCAGVVDVMATVLFARKQGAPVAVRGGVPRLARSGVEVSLA